MEHPIVLFDGVCNFCNASIQFVIDRDRTRTFRFAPLQSELAADLLQQHGMSNQELNSLVLIDERGCSTRSTAALRIARRLRWPWPLLYALIAVPRWLRDPLYDFVARNRYRWFGKLDQCRIPTPELRERFLA